VAARPWVPPWRGLQRHGGRRIHGIPHRREEEAVERGACCPGAQGGAQRHDIHAPVARGQPVEQLPRGVVRPRAAAWRSSQLRLP
jgi:hypothetical protein